ncbi:thioesterase II family protein [Streptomyces sp. NPDC094038]|uniref:thioesterase II family protein n=1 Tax=Streptomyces sp. NPDC094038 TaxID=3366055 RepID=UPI00381F3A17
MSSDSATEAILHGLSGEAAQREQPRALICFPFAGGSTHAYWPLVRHLPASVALYAVQVTARPGAPDCPPSCWQDAVSAVADEMAHRISGEFAFFGHSMGALLGFETARELRRRGSRLPALLAVSGAAAPDQRAKVPDIRAGLDDPGSVQTLSGIPAAWLRRPGFRDRYMATLRADLSLFNAYQHEPEPPLDLPVLAFGGLSDPVVPKFALDAWREHSTHSLSTRFLPGGHFFLWDALPDIVGAVLDAWRQGG